MANEHGRAGASRRAVGWVGAAGGLLLSGCAYQPWTYADKEEAYRMCRGDIPLPVINVFEPDSRAFGTFMCACQVEHLAARVGHERFGNPLYLIEVNGALSEGRSACLMRHRDGKAPNAPP